MFNIGVALGSVQSLPPGIYVAMNGQVFDLSCSGRAQGQRVAQV